jgi:7,8-dihydro-6-hydroxymethylpterin-pyrophosphokinase
MSDKQDATDAPSGSDKSTYLNINIKDICKNLDNESKKASKEVKELQNKLDEQKELYDALRSKYEKEDEKKSDLFDNDPVGLVGDDIFTNRVVEMNKRSKESMDNRAMWDKNTFTPYLEEELQEHENSQSWWEDPDIENEF